MSSNLKTEANTEILTVTNNSALIEPITHNLRSDMVARKQRYPI